MIFMPNITDLDFIERLANNRYKYAYTYYIPDDNMYILQQIQYVFNRNTIEHALKRTGQDNIKSYLSKHDTIDDVLDEVFGNEVINIIPGDSADAVAALNKPHAPSTIAYKTIQKDI